MTKLKDKKPSKLEALKAMSPQGPEPCHRRHAHEQRHVHHHRHCRCGASGLREPTFLSTASIVNIINLTAAKLPIALGVGGCIILGRVPIFPLDVWWVCPPVLPPVCS